MAEIVFKDESFAIIGACFEVYNEMGCGFIEHVYHECLKIELASRGIPFLSQQWLELRYKGILLEQKYQPDFLCYGAIIVEIKAVTEFCDEHRAQVHNYLKATGCRLGLLVNFADHVKMKYERIVR